MKRIEKTGPKSFFDRIRKKPKFEINNRAVMYNDRRLAEYVFINQLYFVKASAKLIDFMRLNHFSGCPAHILNFLI
jgi:hypothetical protein